MSVDFEGGSVGLEGLSPADVEHIRRRLTEAMSRVCPHWLVDEREDLVQAALIRIVGMRGGRVGAGELASTYLWKTANSVMLDEIRRPRWRYERTTDDGRIGDGTPTPGQDPERDAVSKEVATQIHDCLQALEASRRRAVVLHLAGFGRREIVDLLGRSLKQVDNLVHRGTRDLRACLERKGVRP